MEESTPLLANEKEERDEKGEELEHEYHLKHLDLTEMEKNLMQILKMDGNFSVGSSISTGIKTVEYASNKIFELSVTDQTLSSKYKHKISFASVSSLQFSVFDVISSP